MRGLFVWGLISLLVLLMQAISMPLLPQYGQVHAKLLPKKAANRHNQIHKIRWLTTVEGKSQLVLELSQPLNAKLFTLPAKAGKPHRVVLDLPHTQLKTALPSTPSHVKWVMRMRSGIRKKTDLRLVFDVKKRVNARHFLLQPSQYFGYRLVITFDQLRGSINSPIRLASPLPPPPKRPAVTYVKPPMMIPRPPSTVVSPSRKKVFIVAIDAGHGGVDPGAIGRGGSYEKHAALAIAKALYKEMKPTPNLKPILIRDGDYFLPLRQRIQRARQYNADLFISIHADAYPGTQDIQGASVYMLSKSGASSEAAQWLAKKENAADLLGGIRLRDKGDTLASVLLDLSQAGTLELSGQLGQHVLRALGKIGPVHHRSVQQAAFMVLRSPDIPSILIETAFISNPKEERRLNQPAYRKRLARAILQGIQAYFAR